VFLKSTTWILYPIDIIHYVVLEIWCYLKIYTKYGVKRILFGIDHSSTTLLVILITFFVVVKNHKLDVSHFSMLLNSWFQVKVKN